MNTFISILLFLVIILLIIIIYRLIKLSFIYERRLPASINKHNSYLMEDFIFEAHTFIEKVEFEFNIRLSREAKQMLILPLVEVYKINDNDWTNNRSSKFDKYDFEEWRNSIRTLMNVIKSDPARIDQFKSNRQISSRSSLSVIKAFSKKFCNIPPFCGER